MGSRFKIRALLFAVLLVSLATFFIITHQKRGLFEKTEVHPVGDGNEREREHNQEKEQEHLAETNEKIEKEQGNLETIVEMKEKEKEPETKAVQIPVTDKSPSVFPGLCPSVGSFKDAEDCQKIHQCEVNEVGDIFDNVLFCLDLTVWCVRTETCEDVENCPCDEI